MMDFDIEQARSPGLFLRLAALLYDLVLLFGVLMLAVTAVVIPYDLLTGASFPYQEPGHLLALQLFLGAVIVAFFTFFWVRGGQTLGMRAWRFRMVREDGTGLRPKDALRRLFWATIFLAPAGAGLIWVLFDPAGLALHDRLSHTRPVMLKKPS
jgi:uncharacterized RDD family membrane protein YckC